MSMRPGTPAEPDQLNENEAAWLADHLPEMRASIRPERGASGLEKTKAPAEAGAFIAAGFANRKGIFHARFPVLP